MSSLDELERAVLEGAREQLRPSNAARSSALASLRAQIALPNPDVPEIDVPDATNLAGSGGTAGSLAPALRASGLKMLAVGALVGGAVGFASGYSVSTSSHGPEHSASSIPAPPETPEPNEPPPALEGAPQRLLAPAELPPPIEAPPGTTIPTEDSVSRTESEPTARPSPEAARPQATSVGSSEGDTTPSRASESGASLALHEELSYLRRAQAALNAGNATLAWGLMRSLDERRPDGALLLERRVTQVLSLCALGRSDEARAIARQIESSHSASLYIPRLRGSCALPEEAASTNSNKRKPVPSDTKERTSTGDD